MDTYTLETMGFDTSELMELVDVYARGRVGMEAYRKLQATDDHHSDVYKLTLEVIRDDLGYPDGVSISLEAFKRLFKRIWTRIKRMVSAVINAAKRLIGGGNILYQGKRQDMLPIPYNELHDEIRKSGEISDLEKEKLMDQMEAYSLRNYTVHGVETDRVKSLYDVKGSIVHTYIKGEGEAQNVIVNTIGADFICSKDAANKMEIPTNTDAVAWDPNVALAHLELCKDALFRVLEFIKYWTTDEEEKIATLGEDSKGVQDLTALMTHAARDADLLVRLCRHIMKLEEELVVIYKRFEEAKAEKNGVLS